MNNKRTRKLTIAAMSAAIVAICTMVITIPVPLTNGYINLGDGVILTVAYAFGGGYAVIAGAVGSALADLLKGYAQWAPFTFVIKGAMGFAAGKIFVSDKNVFHTKNILAVLAAEAIMVAGYYVADSIMISSFIVGLQGVPPNLIQAAGAFAVFSVLGASIKKALPKNIA